MWLLNDFRNIVLSAFAWLIINLLLLNYGFEMTSTIICIIYGIYLIISLLFLYRPPFKIRMISEKIDTPKINFEITNLRKKPIYINRKVLLEAYMPKYQGIHLIKFYKIKIHFIIKDENKRIEPEEPKKFTATSNQGEEVSSLWFKKYTLRTTLGIARRLYVRSADSVVLSYLRYDYELFLSRWFGDRFLYEEK